MEKYRVFDCSIIELDKHHSDRKGNLTVVQNGDSADSPNGTLPFNVKRVYRTPELMINKLWVEVYWVYSACIGGCDDCAVDRI